MCLIYSIVFSEFVSSQHFAVFSQWHFADFQSLSGGYFSIFTLFSCQFSRPFLLVSWHLFVAASLFFLSFLQCFSNSPFRHFVFLFQLKMSFIFLNFSLNFCSFQLYVIVINLSIIFSCVHHFLISPIWKQQEKQNKTEQLDRWRNYPVCLTRYHSLQTKWVI